MCLEYLVLVFNVQYWGFKDSVSCHELVLCKVHRDTATETARVGLRLLVLCNVLKYVMSTALT